MTRSKIAIVLMSIALLPALFSCSKDDDTLSNPEFLSYWKVINSDIDPRTSMTVTFQVKGIDVNADASDKVAAFVEGECRGVTTPTVLDSSYYFQLLINFKQPSDDKTGKSIDLYYYSATKGKYYRSSSPDLKLDKDLTIGDIDNPYIPSSWTLLNY